jgi:hypothetical protein
MYIYSVNEVFQNDLSVLLTHNASSQSTRSIKSIKGTIAVRNPDRVVTADLTILNFHNTDTKSLDIDGPDVVQQLLWSGHR